MEDNCKGTTCGKTYHYEFIKFLNVELSKRKKNNPSYSLRSFAKFLNYESSFLSKLLRGRLLLTREQFDKISSKLNISQNDIENFWEDVEAETKKVEFCYIKNCEIKTIPKESFKVLGHWYCFVLLSMLGLDDFDRDPKWIAKKINIKESEAQDAIEKLQLVGLITQDCDGKLRATNANCQLEIPGFEGVYRDILTAYQREIINKTSELLITLPPESYAHDTATMLIDSDLQKEAFEKIHEFTKKLALELEQKSKKKNQVFELTISFLPWLKRE